MSRMARTLRPLLTVLIAGAIAACNQGKDPDKRRVGIDAFQDTSNGSSSVCGSLTVGVIAEDPETSLREGGVSGDHLFHTRFVADDDYDGMEDNDLRGFLDGAFKEGWNQVSQSHLRLGRRGRNPAFGEFELFRNLHRWSNLGLPTGIDIDNASLELFLESGPPFPADVAVYAVHKDWNPGSGGTNRDNNSPPAPGEVWWLEAKAGETRWQRPGVGYASDTDSAADTGGQPLALARYTPGAGLRLTFTSESLAGYVEDRVRSGLPVLLLYKLTDPYEDSIGSVMEIWSANFGTQGSSRRPALSIDWRPAGPMQVQRYDLVLESGRFVNLGQLDTAGARFIVADFEADESQAACSGTPWIEVRSDDSESSWAPLERVRRLTAPSVVLRAAAVSNPVELGSATTVRLRDTWVPDGSPEEQQVVWTFEAPDGRQIRRSGEYAGDYVWRVELPADMIGRWKYRWRHEFSGKPVQSEQLVYDVVAWSPEVVSRGLELLATEIGRSGATPKSHEMTRFELAFMRLERAAMALPPGDAASPGIPPEIEQSLRDLRELLSGKPVPDQYEAKPIRSRE